MSPTAQRPWLLLTRLLQVAMCGLLAWAFHDGLEWPWLAAIIAGGFAALIQGGLLMGLAAVILIIPPVRRTLWRWTNNDPAAGL